MDSFSLGYVRLHEIVPLASVACIRKLAKQAYEWVHTHATHVYVGSYSGLRFDLQCKLRLHSKSGPTLAKASVASLASTCSMKSRYVPKVRLVRTEGTVPSVP